MASVEINGRMLLPTDPVGVTPYMRVCPILRPKDELGLRKAPDEERKGTLADDYCEQM